MWTRVHMPVFPFRRTGKAGQRGRRSLPAVSPTIVSTNRPTGPIETNGLATMPAVYAQTYQGGNGKRYVVPTNKGSNAVPV
jgi:hypothetical protein